MKRTKTTPDPVRDPPKDSGGDYQCPGAYMIVPARAYGDDRFNQYPMTFRAFGICCAHANSWTGVFFPNQLYVANVLQCSQQAVSQHMRKLVQWGYIEKLRNQDIRRSYGKRGALWRVIYDPTKTLDDCISGQPADDRDPEMEAEIARNTLAKLKNDMAVTPSKPVDKIKDNKPQVVQGTAGIGTDTDTSHKPDLVQSNKVELVNNSSNITNKKTSDYYSEMECKRVCQAYSQLVNQTYGRAWSYDMRQLNLAGQILAKQTQAEFIADAEQFLQWAIKKGKQAPHSLQYFLQRIDSKEKAQAGTVDTADMVKQLANRMRLKR